MGRVWSVLVVTGTFVNLLLSNGFRFCIGLFFVKWQEEFNGTAEEIGWIASFILIGYATAGISVAMFGSRLSCRFITSSGGTLACIALACCVFAKAVWHLFLLMFILGFGLGIVRNASLTVIGFYVKKRIGFAYGFVGAGSSFGLLILSPIVTALIEFFSWRGAMLVMSGIMANVCVVGALYRQTSSETMANAKQLHSNSDKNDKCNEKAYPENTFPSAELDQAFFGYLPVETKRPSSFGKRIRKTSNQVAEGVRRASIQMVTGIRRTSVQIADGITRSNAIAIITNIRLISFNVSLFLRGFAFFASLAHYVVLCLDNGISLTTSSVLLTVVGISGTASCLSHGILLDKKLITPLHLLSVTLITAGASCIMIAIYPNFTTLTIFAIVFGGSASIFNGLVPSGIRQVLEDDIHLVKGSLGIAMTVASVGGLIGIPVIGRLFDITKDYTTSCYVAGSVFCASGILHCMDHVLVRYQNRRDETSEDNEPNARESDDENADNTDFAMTLGVTRKTSTVSFSIPSEIS